MQVSSVRSSKSDDKRLSIFTGTKTLHLRCLSREDRTTWIDALLVAKDQFPRMLTSGDFALSEDFVVSTEKLRTRLLQEGIGEAVIKDCEAILECELGDLQRKLKGLHLNHMMLLETLRQLEVIVVLTNSSTRWMPKKSILKHMSSDLKEQKQNKKTNHRTLLFCCENNDG